MLSHVGLSFNDLVCRWASLPEYPELAAAKQPYQKVPFYIFRTVGATVNDTRRQLMVLHRVGSVGTHVLTLARDSRKSNWAIVVSRHKKLFPMLVAQQRLPVHQLVTKVLNSDIGPMIKVFRDHAQQHVQLQCRVIAWSPGMDQFCLRVRPQLQLQNSRSSCMGVRHLVCVLDTTLDLLSFEKCCKLLLKIASAFIGMVGDRRPILTYLSVYTSPPYHTLVHKLPLCGSASILTLSRELEGVKLLEPDAALVANTIVAVSSVIREHHVGGDYLLCCRNEVFSYFQWKYRCTHMENPFPVSVACVCTNTHVVSFKNIKKLLKLSPTGFGIGPYSWRGVGKVYYGAYIEEIDTEVKLEYSVMIQRVVTMVKRRMVNRPIVITLGDQISMRMPFIAESEGGFDTWLVSGALPLSDYERGEYRYGIDVPISCHNHQFINVQWASFANGCLGNPQTDIVFVQDSDNWVRRSPLLLDGESECGVMVH